MLTKICRSIVVVYVVVYVVVLCSPVFGFFRILTHSTEMRQNRKLAIGRDNYWDRRGIKSPTKGVTIDTDLDSDSMRDILRFRMSVHCRILNSAGLKIWCSNLG